MEVLDSLDILDIEYYPIYSTFKTGFAILLVACRVKA